MSSIEQTAPILNDERLIEFEAKLIEQEHRVTHIVANFFGRKQQFPNPLVPRRKACARAVIWRMFFTPASAIVGSGVIGATSLAILIWQGFLQRENNQLLLRQLQPNVEIYASASSAAVSDRKMEVEVVIFNPGTEPCYIETGQWVADGNDIGHGHGVIRPVGNRVVPSKSLQLVRLVIDDDIDLSKVIAGSYVVPSEQLGLFGDDYLVGIQFDVIARVPTTQKVAGKFKCELRKNFPGFDGVRISRDLIPKKPLRLEEADAFIPPDHSKQR